MPARIEAKIIARREGAGVRVQITRLQKDDVDIVLNPTDAERLLEALREALSPN